MPGSRSENQHHLYLLLIAASCALSALAILRDPILDDVGVLHLLLAREIADTGIGAALALFDRPVYPILIAGLHQLSGLSLLASAHLLGAALLALLVLGFTRFAVLLCGERELAPWIALLVLLFPLLNEYRSQVLRDFGFWALLVCSLLALLRYQATLRWRHGLWWALLGAASAAFRPEALVYMALLPLSCLQGETRATRLMNAARLYACMGLLALPPLLVLARFDMLQAPLDALAGTLESVAATIAEGFAGASARYADTVLDPRVGALAPVALAAGLLTVLALKFAAALGPVYCVLLGWGVAAGRAGLPSVARRTWRVLGGIALLIVVTVVLARQFVAERYLVMPCLLALIPAALALRSFAETARRERRQGAFHLVLGIAIVLLVADGLVRFGTRQDYRHQAIAWMQDELPADARVFSNDRTLAYYSGGRFDRDAVSRGDALIVAQRAPLAGVEYWVVRRDGRNPALDAALAAYVSRLEPLARFDNGREATIEVFRVTAGAGPQ
ncbi:MAG: hypothetical protein IPF57_21005 [Gammaproteobacteria bacterium]|jgi:hypothetical protein|nr:hypothetical protein [Gammaproteobacteria bacterium]MBP6480353.1 hypothetical protein [Pseudomonadales bacterium]MBP7909971.1 hypothetical protein [Pseudomonadales bacterium]